MGREGTVSVTAALEPIVLERLVESRLFSSLVVSGRCELIWESQNSWAQSSMSLFDLYAVLCR